MVAYADKPKNDDYYSAASKRDATTYELAGVGTRAVALFIDGLILPAIGGLSSLGAHSPSGFVFGLLISIGYYWFFLTRFNGQTPGKMLMSIRVIKTDGSPITGKDAAIRYLGYYVNTFTMGLGWIWPMLDRNTQGFHDKMANTYVVRA
jgi:uncharacterized RDD family membrane protein YckC